jgi:peptidoglycan/LPS O-acetylase OafA/YrhL
MRQTHLDGLRGCAACVVLFGHLGIAFNSRFTGYFNGNAAVCVFFVLSGYVLTDLSQRSELTLPAQVLRRFVRLVGPILLTSAFAWALLALGLFRNQQAAATLNSWWLGSWYKFDASFYDMFVESIYGVFANGQSIYNCNLWTMRPEFIGSLYLFVINYTAPSRGLRGLCYIALAFVYMTQYLPLFSIGALLYEFQPELANLLKRLRDKAPATAFGSFALTFAIGLWLGQRDIPTGGTIFTALTSVSEVLAANSNMYLHMVSATVVVAVTLHWPLLHTVLGSRIGQFLGKISFVLYLIQVPIICSFTSWLYLALAPIDVSLASKVASLATIVVVISVSAATCRFVDQAPTRFSRYAGRFLDTFFGPVPIPEAPNVATGRL